MGLQAQRVLVLELQSELADYWSGELWSLGATAIEERDGSTPSDPIGEPQIQLIASFLPSRDISALVVDLSPHVRAREEVFAPVDWVNEWKKHFEPTLVSSRIFVCPSWNTPEPPIGAHRLIIDPGPAFGSGTHETTQLALRAIDRTIVGGERVYDVGCGSGILAIAAALLGAARVTANDIDESAIAFAQENIERNGVGDRVSVSLDALGKAAADYQVVVANIQLDVLQQLEGELWNLVAPGGALLLTGLLLDQLDAIKRAYKRWAFVQSEELAAWALVEMKKANTT